MSDKMRKVLRVLLLTVFVISTVLLVSQWMDNSSGQAAYQEALDVALSATQAATVPTTQAPETETTVETVPVETEPPIRWVPAPIGEDANLESLEQINLDSLQGKNSDILGWIRIPQTTIDYPMLQGEDNEFYLEHTWNKAEISVGSIFLECMNSPDLTDFNSIVYGHNMRDGSMFAGIRRYWMEDYMKRRPYVYIVLPDTILRYEIYSSYEASLDAPTYGLSFNQESTREAFIAYTLENSVVDSGIVPATTDRILTLSTCSGDSSKRWVVHARLPMIQEEPSEMQNAE